MIDSDGGVERAFLVAGGTEGPEHDALRIVAEDTAAGTVHSNVNVIFQNGDVHQLGGAVSIGAFLPVQLADGGITVILDQNVVADAVQAADGLGVVPQQVVLVKADVGGIDEGFIIHVDVVVLSRNEGFLLSPLFLGGEVHLPDVLSDVVGNLVGADVASKGAIAFELDQTLVDVGSQNEHASGAVHNQLAGQEAEGLVIGSVGGLDKLLDEVQVLVHLHHAAVVGIADVDGSFLVHENVAGGVEGGNVAAGNGINDPYQLVALGLEANLQQPVVAGIADVDVIVADEKALRLFHRGFQLQGGAVQHGVNTISVGRFANVAPVIVVVGI